MNYIVYDTEFNQPQPKLYNPNSRFRPNPISPFEIIEIGAVKINENLEIVDTFDRLIKPVIYKTLSPIVVRKTKIRKENLANGSSFPKAIKDLKKWMGHEYIMCSWSSNDVGILRSNCQYHKMDIGWLDEYYDIQKHCTKLLNLPKNQTIGLKNAIEAFNIKMDGKLHRALEDAMYTAKIFIKVHSEETRPTI